MAEARAAFACLAARFSFRDFPDFLVMLCRGDLSAITGPLIIGGLVGPDALTLPLWGLPDVTNRPPTPPRSTGADSRVYRQWGWEPSQSGMRQPFAADLGEHPLTPDTPVTTLSRDHLESSTHSSIVCCPCCGATLFPPTAYRHSQHASTDTVRAGDVQRGVIRRVVGEWRRRQRGAGGRRVAFFERPGHRRAGQRLTGVGSGMRRVTEPERHRGHPA